MRVAYTLEQLWHRVPGGTAVAAVETATRLRGRRRTRARRRLGLASAACPSRRGGRRSRSARLPVPPHVLYETWHRLRRPHVERATGPVDVIHATGVAVPPRTAPLVVTVHDLSYLVYPEHFSRQGRRFFRRALDCTRRDADLVLCSSEATRGTARRPASTRGGSASSRSARTSPQRPRRTSRASVRPTALDAAVRPLGRHARAAEEPAAAARGLRPARHRRWSSSSSAPAAGTRSSTRRRARACSASSRRPTWRRSTPARPRSASQPARGLRHAGRGRDGAGDAGRHLVSGRRPRSSRATRGSSSIRATSTRSRAPSTGCCATPSSPPARRGGPRPRRDLHVGAHGRAHRGGLSEVVGR